MCVSNHMSKIKDSFLPCEASAFFQQVLLWGGRGAVNALHFDQFPFWESRHSKGSINWVGPKIRQNSAKIVSPWNDRFFSIWYRKRCHMVPTFGEIVEMEDHLLCI